MKTLFAPGHQVRSPEACSSAPDDKMLERKYCKPDWRPRRLCTTGGSPRPPTSWLSNIIFHDAVVPAWLTLMLFFFCLRPRSDGVHFWRGWRCRQPSYARRGQHPSSTAGHGRVAHRRWASRRAPNGLVRSIMHNQFHFDGIHLYDIKTPPTSLC